MGCNLSKKHKLTQYKTQNGESQIISFSLIFTRSYLLVQNLGDRHPDTKSSLVGWCMYFVTLKLHNVKFTSVSVSWIHHGSTSCLCLYFTFLVKVFPPPFHYKLGSYLYLFLLYILFSQDWWQDQSQYLCCQKKMHYSSSRNIAIC